ncbi:MAG: hypothetical protein KJ955_07370 [Nanoarchaeota archaeon]|nr:hypothetical protein [Nanoarchaeota archaeon]
MALEEQKNYGFIAGVRAEEIYRYLSERDNRASLEAILKTDTEARGKLPFWGNAGTKVKKAGVEEILKEAKQSVDSFFSLDAGKYNPSLYAKSFLFGYHQMVLATGFLAGIGAMHSYPPNIPFLQNMPPFVTALGQVTLLAGIVWLGISTSKALFGSSLYAYGEYNHERNTIIGLRSRRNLFKHMLLREYTRAASVERIRREPMAYLPFENGFAESVAGRLMLREDEGEHAIALNKARKQLKKGIECLKIHRTEFAQIAQKLDKEKMPKDYKKCLMGMGYCLFRLAEERHGEDIYREVYNGNTRILFD